MGHSSAARTIPSARWAFAPVHTIAAAAADSASLTPRWRASRAATVAINFAPLLGAAAMVWRLPLTIVPPARTLANPQAQPPTAANDGGGGRGSDGITT